MRFTILGFTLLAIFTILAACKTKQAAQKNDDSKLVKLTTSSCYGFCPAYTVTVLNNGSYLFEPNMFTYQTENMTVQLTKDELAKLKTSLRGIDLTKYPDKIKTQVMDAPMSTLTTFTPEKSVMGSMDRPAELLELESLIKDLGIAHGIETKKGRNPSDPDPQSAGQLILHLKDDVNVGNWIAQFGDLKTRIIKRVAKSNTWLIEYDQSQITESQILDIFRTNESVESVLPQKLSEERY